MPKILRAAGISLRLFSIGLVSLGLASSIEAQEQKVPKEPSGTITIDETQMALLISGSLGGGVLNYRGKSYNFKVGGLGVGGVGISEIKAKGEVYSLNNIAEFPGVYGQVSTGYAAGETKSGGMWLQNPKGVTLRLDTERSGLILTAGAEGVVIRMTE
jgi:hypothetical protein